MAEKFEPGVPLAHYRQHRATVRTFCRNCALTLELDLEEVIAGLVARGRGDENTGIRAVAKTFRRPCERCGMLAWETTPGFPSIPGQDGLTKA